jgi:hypothetical protein
MRKVTVTGQDEQQRRDRWTALGIRTDIPYPARVYDYLLGGKDNFAADREMAELSLRVMPEVLDSARANRKFLARAVRFLCDSGIQQFLDIGTGLPTSPNTYEIAQSGAPGARVVCVDSDPVVVLRAESLMAGNQATMVVRADLRDAGHVAAAAGKLLDLTKPVGLLLVACLHNIPDPDDPAGIVALPDGPRARQLPGHLPRHRRVRPGQDARGLRGIPAAGHRLHRPQQGRHPAHVQRQGTGHPRARADLPLAARWRPPRTQR